MKRKLTLRGWVAVKDGHVYWLKNKTGDYREIPFTKTREMAQQLWTDVRKAVLIVEAK